MGKIFSVKDRRDLRHLDKGTPYYEYRKYPEPTRCLACGLVFANGRWTHGRDGGIAVHGAYCPACRIIRDHIPMGVAVFEGGYVEGSHADDIRNVIRNVERRVSAQRPLQRIMQMRQEDGRITVFTTYDHLARRIGEAVSRAFKGELSVTYAENERFARIFWHRD